MTEEQKRRIWRAIFCNMQDDDRDPYVVIADRYKGNVKQYLRKMAHWHKVAL